MEKQNYTTEENPNNLEDINQLITKVNRLELESRECNTSSCSSFGCSLEPRPGMYCNNNICNTHCISKIPSTSEHHKQPSPSSNELGFLQNFNHPSTSISPGTRLPQKSPCDTAEMTKVCHLSVIAPPNWETSVIENQVDLDYTPRLNYYCQQKPFRSHRPQNGL